MFSLPRYFHNTKGVVFPITALVLPVVIGFSGIGIDAGVWMMTRSNLQTAADSAALAGAWEIARGHDDTYDQSSLKEAIHNGYDPSEGGVLDAVYNSADDTVEVTIQQEVPSYFTRYFTNQSPVTSVTAEATVMPGDDDFCILSLETVEAQALTTSGSVNLSMPDCGIAVNSGNSDAFHVNGNVTIDVATISITGEMGVSGGSASVTYDEMNEHAPPVQDPYDDLNPPYGTTCDYNNVHITGGGTKTLNPGTYCGGLDISGNNNVVFNPGIYTFKGGTVDIRGGGTLTANGVSMLLTANGSDYANVSISGGKNMTFTAPTSGPTAGMVMYQDPNAPDTKVNSLLGTANMTMDGILYFPSQELNIGGNSTASSGVCTKVVARTVILHGNPYIGNDCSGSGIDPITTPSVRLTG